MLGKNSLSPEEQKALESSVEAYLAGESRRSISRRIGVSMNAIASYYKRNGIELRTTADSVRLSYERDEREKAGRKPKYTKDETFFQKLTPDSAYVIGLIQADGTLTKDRFSISAAIKEGGREYLEMVRDLLGSNRPLQEVTHPAGRVYRLCINSSPMVADLRRWSIVENKTYAATTHKDLLLNRDYWRGVIDGDGCLHTTGAGKKILYLSGTPMLCQQFLNFAKKFGIGEQLAIRKSEHSAAYTTRFNGKEAILLARELYHGSTVRMERKYAIYQEWERELCRKQLKKSQSGIQLAMLFG